MRELQPQHQVEPCNYSDSLGEAGAAWSASQTARAVCNGRHALSARAGLDMSGRQKDDSYPTPEIATSSLLDVEMFDEQIWEPAAGDGAIAKVLKARLL